MPPESTPPLPFSIVGYLSHAGFCGSLAQRYEFGREEFTISLFRIASVVLSAVFHCFFFERGLLVPPDPYLASADTDRAHRLMQNMQMRDCDAVEANGGGMALSSNYLQSMTIGSAGAQSLLSALLMMLPTTTAKRQATSCKQSL